MSIKSDNTSRKILDLFIQINLMYEFCMAHTLDKYGLYEGQPSVLFKVRELNYPKQNDLAKALGISKSSVGVSLRRLEKNGFIAREDDSTDSRCMRIKLTKKGEEFTHWCDIDMDMLANNMMELFTNDEHARLIEDLERMYKGLENMRARIKS